VAGFQGRSRLPADTTLQSRRSHDKLERLYFVCGITVTSVELYSLYSSPDTIRQIKSRRVVWAGHVARKGVEGKVQKVLVGKPKRKNHSEDQDVDGRMRSEWILGRLAGRV
jgi:hypothetical protein